MQVAIDNKLSWFVSEPPFRGYYYLHWTATFEIYVSILFLLCRLNENIFLRLNIDMDLNFGRYEEPISVTTVNYKSSRAGKYTH